MANGLKPSDVLVCGHTHTATNLLEECQAASLGCFVGEKAHGINPPLEYGMLHFVKNKFRVTLKTGEDLM